LGELLSECVQFDSSLEFLRQDCGRLATHAVDVRYPDVPVPVTEKLGQEAVQMSEAICGAIRQRLPIT
jgi:hypothetical protein